jgi:DNA integrity scanning protein DisA with diadenylate cyclase activity
MTTQQRAVETEVIKACIDISIQNTSHGCILVVDLSGRKRDGYYAKVFQHLKGEKGKLLSVRNEQDKHIIKHIVTIDGAAIIDQHGNMTEFGVTLKNPSTFFGHGKRHAFALGTSKLKGIVCILASEEDGHVRLFRDGACMADIDAKSYVPGNLREKVAEMLCSPIPQKLVDNLSKSSHSGHSKPMITITGSSLIISPGFDKLQRML